MLVVPRQYRAASVAVLITVVLASLLSGCQPTSRGLRLVIASGSSQGVYHDLSGVLANAWRDQLGIPTPTVIDTQGSLDNINRLRIGAADVGFSAADAAAEAILRPTPGARSLRALARMHDDYFQVVVRAESPVRTLSDLRGKRVSIGELSSGVLVIAQRLLEAAGMSAQSDIVAQYLSLNESVDALRNGTIDAFFWSGGLPTRGIHDLASTVPLRIVDLSDVLPTLRKGNLYPVYGTASVPVSIYGLAPPPATTLVVRNFLLVTDAMPDDVAEALTRGVFAAQPQLVNTNVAARSIDPRSAIETWPIPLHPGAERYYRSAKF